MFVILTTDVENLGKAGEIVKVKDGYARNYLFPRNLAKQANVKDKIALENQKKMVSEKIHREKKNAFLLAQKLENISITIPVKTADESKIFGSITTKDIIEAIKKEGLEIDKKQIILEEPIKSIGFFTVPVKLHPEVEGIIKLWVIAENVPKNT